jgi:hypothetical protein
MQKFAKNYPDLQIVQAALAQTTHNYELRNSLLRNCQIGISRCKASIGKMRFVLENSGNQNQSSAMVGNLLL